MTSENDIQFYKKILDTLDSCIEKIKVSLREHFDPTDNDSIRLYKHYTKAMNERKKIAKLYQSACKQAAQSSPPQVDFEEQNRPLNLFRSFSIHMLN